MDRGLDPTKDLPLGTDGVNSLGIVEIDVVCLKELHYWTGDDVEDTSLVSQIGSVRGTITLVSVRVKSGESSSILRGETTYYHHPVN